MVPRRREVRRSFGINDDAPVILFSGKLVSKKQPLLLLEAFRRVRAERPCHLLLAGEGPLRPDLEAQIASKKIPDVHLAGFLNQTEIATAYTAADVFALPSAYDETWGVVINEAMNFALPIVLSDRVGSARDLVRNGWNGFVFASGNLDQLAAALSGLIDDESKRRLFGARSLELIEPYTYENCAEQILDACRTVMDFKAKEQTGTAVPEPYG
jgi:glycosyltransferase involved in cell wall biosynthesis